MSNRRNMLMLLLMSHIDKINVAYLLHVSLECGYLSA